MYSLKLGTLRDLPDYTQKSQQLKACTKWLVAAKRRGPHGGWLALPYSPDLKCFFPHRSYVHIQLLSYTRLFATPWTVTTRLFCPWDFPGKNTGVDWYFLLQGIFPTQGSNPNLLPLRQWQAGSLPVGHVGSPIHCLQTFIRIPDFKSKRSRKKCALVRHREVTSLGWGTSYNICDHVCHHTLEPCRTALFIGNVYTLKFIGIVFRFL